MYPIKLKPIYDKTIWANNKLTTIRGVDSSEYGTCWEVSAHSYCQNEIMNGEYAGQDLMTVIQKCPTEMLGKHDESKLLRLAYLDAKSDLSIQVHPHEAYAKTNDNDHGKTEAWYVLEAEPGSTLVAGTKISDEELIRTSIEDGTLEEHLVKVPINKGDFIHIDAGMLHALGGGIFAIEVGTNSNVTYRFYDYQRKDAQGNSRELHLDKSFDVVDLTKESQKIANPFQEVDETTCKTLCNTEFFKVDLIDVKDSITLKPNNAFMTITFVSKDATVKWNDGEIQCKYTDSIFIPASCPEFEVITNGRLLVSTVE